MDSSALLDLSEHCFCKCQEGQDQVACWMGNFEHGIFFLLNTTITFV